MYTWRVVFTDKTEFNTSLGNAYKVISCESERFKEMKSQFYKDNLIPSDYTQIVYKFIIAQDGTEYPVFLNNSNYIVSENGATFARL